MLITDNNKESRLELSRVLCLHQPQEETDISARMKAGRQETVMQFTTCTTALDQAQDLTSISAKRTL